MAHASAQLALPSVEEFTSNAERYPGFPLVTVLSTGKMKVMNRAEATGDRKVKIISRSNQETSNNSAFFAGTTNTDTTGNREARNATNPRDSTSENPAFVSGFNPASFIGSPAHLRFLLAGMGYVFAFDLMTGAFVFVSNYDFVREPWRYRIC